MSVEKQRLIAEIATEFAAEIAGGMELKVLLVAICYWNSLESYTSLQRVVGV